MYALYVGLIFRIKFKPKCLHVVIQHLWHILGFKLHWINEPYFLIKFVQHGDGRKASSNLCELFLLLEVVRDMFLINSSTITYLLMNSPLDSLQQLDNLNPTEIFNSELVQVLLTQSFRNLILIKIHINLEFDVKFLSSFFWNAENFKNSPFTASTTPHVRFSKRQIKL